MPVNTPRILTFYFYRISLKIILLTYYDIAAIIEPLNIRQFCVYGRIFKF